MLSYETLRPSWKRVSDIETIAKRMLCTGKVIAEPIVENFFSL